MCGGCSAITQASGRHLEVATPLACLSSLLLSTIQIVKDFVFQWLLSGAKHSEQNLGQQSLEGIHL
jgi:hypothetical protein